MRVVTAAGSIDLGTTEATPSIGIIDYSRRVTDDFGVTTVVPRGFSRRMSVRFALPTTQVDSLQRLMADLRATPARWVADEQSAWLSPTGIYKDFEIDVAFPPLSYGTLTVEGVAETEAAPDAGGDPAPDGVTSTLRVVRPAAIGDAQLIASSVAENDAAQWAADVTYAKGARVIRAASHRLFESASAGNLGSDPLAADGTWIDVGPTNRWAMLDQALGSVTSSAAPIVVTINAGAARAVALLDVVGATVRIQAPGYDRTQAIGAGAITFLDLPGQTGDVTVTIVGSGAGSGTVSVGTLLIGDVVSLGITEAAPTAGITDYSRKVVDDFGAVTIVQRSWAKRMTARALIRTDAIDAVADRIAAVRAQPSLWIADSAMDSLTLYGFFKDFAIERGEAVSKLSLSIEGLSTAGKVEPLRTSIDWPDIGDPTGTKPADNADVTKDALPDAFHDITGRTPVQVANDLASAVDAIGLETMRAATWRGESDTILYAADGRPIRTVVEAIGGDVGGIKQFVAFLKEVDTSAGTSKFLFSAKADGTIVGIEGMAGDGVDQLSFMASRFLFVDSNGQNPVRALTYEGGVWKMKSIEVDRLKVNTAIVPVRATAASDIGGTFTAWPNDAPYPTQTALTASIYLPVAGYIEVLVSAKQHFTRFTDSPYAAAIYINGSELTESLTYGTVPGDTLVSTAARTFGPGWHTVELRWNGAYDMILRGRSMFVKGFPATE